MDIIKTRLQVQGSSTDAVRRGIWGTATGIVKEEGAARLYSGIVPACLRHVVYVLYFLYNIYI